MSFVDIESSDGRMRRRVSVQPGQVVPLAEGERIVGRSLPDDPPPGKTRFWDQPNLLTFAQLREANLKRLEHFPGHNDEGDAPGSVMGGWTYNDWMVSLTGEVGELANLLKKRRRGWVGPGQVSYDPDKAAEELADIATYLDLLAACLGVDLAEAVVRKFNTVSERAGLPDRL